MRVLFDYQAFTLQQYGGVSRCFAQLYRQLAKDNDVRISIRETNNAYLKELGIVRPVGYDYAHFLTHKDFKGKVRLFALKNSLKYGLPYSACHIPYTDASKYGRLESIKALKEGNFDVFHPTFFDDYFLPYLNGKPFVLTIHDMIPELYPQYFDHETDEQILGKRKLAPLASAIIAVSQNTKDDIVRLLRIPEEKVHVIHHGSEHIGRCASACNPAADTPYITPYIIYVGGRNYYKDFDLFTKKAASVLKLHSGLKVICTGHPFTPGELALMDRLGVKDQFVSRWVSNDNEMAALYHNALCFVYTSEYEGFGIPILEAYAAGCPVLLNNASCFPEIAGAAAIYFNFENLPAQLEKVIGFTVQERNALLSKQKTQLQKYSWEQSAKQLLQVYESVLSNY